MAVSFTRPPSQQTDNNQDMKFCQDIIPVAPLFPAGFNHCSRAAFRAPRNEDGLRDLNALSPLKPSECCVL